MNFWIKNNFLVNNFLVGSFLVVASLLLFSCKEKPKEVPFEWNKQKSIELGSRLSNEENEDIEFFIDQNENLHFDTTGTGLRIAYLKHGDGQLALRGMTAEIRFKISLLDGTLCYESELDKNDYFNIDHEDVESGIQEGIKLMHIGDKCKMVMPSNLAHGLIGDMDKIPPLSPIVVDLELIDLK